MDNVTRTGGGWGRWMVKGVFAVLGVIVVVAAVVSAWQASVHRSETNEIESRVATVSLLQEVEEESGMAATLLQEYVASGDATLVPEIQSHSNAATGSLRQAAAESDAAGIDGLAAEGAGLAEGATQIVALRMSGNAQGAAAALEAATPAFEDVSAGLARVTEQLQDVDALQSKADRAADLSRWSLIVAVAAGGTLMFAGVALFARSLMRRRASRPAVPA